MVTNSLPSIEISDIHHQDPSLLTYEATGIAASRRALDILSNSSGLETISQLLELIREISGADFAAFGILRGETHEFVRFMECGNRPNQLDDIGIQSLAVAMLKKCIGRDQFYFDSGFSTEFDVLKSAAGILVRRDSRPQGILFLAQMPHGESECNRRMEIVQSLSGFVSMAVHNLQLLAQQRRLIRAVMAAQEEERRRIAYDLHDGVAQYVLASHAHLQSFKYAQEIGNKSAASIELEHGLGCLKKAIVESRRLINGQRSLALDDVGLGGALQQLLNDEKGRAGWTEAILIDNTATKDF